MTDHDPQRRPSLLTLRSSVRGAAGSERRFVGLLVSAGCKEIRGALVRLTGHALDTHAEVLAHARDSIPEETSALYDELAAGRSTSPGVSAELSAQLAPCQAAVVQRLMSQAAIAADRVMAIGVYDPGLWRLAGGERAYASLCDAARLAEATGLSVIDAFPARDLAHGGQGGPVLALPLWLLLRDERRTRALLDLGRTARVTYLPDRERSAMPWLLSFDVSPGTSLLDRLAQQLTEGEHQYDPHGHLAVQGRRIPRLVEHWLDDPYFKRPPPRWHPLGCRHERELEETARMAVEAGWSVRDLLCTGCHFIAEAIARAVNERLPRTPPIDELILSGGGQHNGMLLRGITERLAGKRLFRVNDVGLADAALEPAAVTLLAALHVDHVAANLTSVTGAEAPRVLGRLTPGAAQNWRRLLREMADNCPSSMPLRSAM